MAFEIANAVDSFYTWKTINSRALSNEKFMRLINLDSTFWNTLQYSLQTNFIITLGRIFDAHKGTHSIEKLLEEMVNNSQFFSKDSLRKRKIAAVGQPQPEWLENYLSEAFEPNTSDLQKIRSSLTLTIKIYHSIYNPVRNKMFAHRDVGIDVGNLLGQAKITGIEEIFSSLHDIMLKISQLYQNGREPDQTNAYDLNTTIDQTEQRIQKTLEFVVPDDT